MRRGDIVMCRGEIAVYLERNGPGMVQCVDADGGALAVPRAELSERIGWLGIRRHLLTERRERPRRYLCRLERVPGAPLLGVAYTVPDDGFWSVYAPRPREYHAAWLALIGAGDVYRVVRAMSAERKVRAEVAS